MTNVPSPSETKRRPLRDTVISTLWLASVIGLVELLILAIKQWGLGIPIFATPQIVWMAAVSYAVVFLPVALVLFIPARRWPRLFGVRTQVLIFVFAGVYSALKVLDVQLHEAAIVLLSLGAAVQGSRSAANAVEQFRRLTRRSLPWLLGTIALLTVWVNGSRVLGEWRGMAALPDAPTEAPNVLVIILDTVRALSLGLFGYERPTTPNLAELAGTGVVFDRASSTASWTNPSHASIFTGHFPYNVTSDWGAGLDDTHPTLAEALRDRGYATGGFSANTRYVTRQSGLGRGFIRFEDYPLFSVGGTMGSTWLGRFFIHKNSRIGRLLRLRDVPGRKNAPEITDPLLRWIDGLDGRPFFAALNYMDGHDPYLPPEPFASRFSDSPRLSLGRRIINRLRGVQVDQGPETDPNERWMRHEREAYDGALAYLDHEMDRLLGELDARGLLDNTLVILTSDHGEEFNEHGVMGHGKSLYWTSVHVPLVLWFPGRAPAGIRIDAPVSNRSIPATVLDLLGADSGVAFPGVSFARYWEGDSTAVDTVLSELTSDIRAPQRAPIGKGDMKSLVIGTYHYIRNGDGSEEIYDIVTDPFEHANLIATLSDEQLAPFRRVIDAIPARTSRLSRTF